MTKIKKIVILSIVAILLFSTITVQTAEASTLVLRYGMTHTLVRQLQTNLIKLKYMTLSTPTNYYGTITRTAVTNFQKANNLSATGIADITTQNLIVQRVAEMNNQGNLTYPPGYTRTLRLYNEGEDVRRLQVDLDKAGFRVVANPTTYFGSLTQSSLRKFQTANNLRADGIADLATLTKLAEVVKSKEIPAVVIQPPFTRPLSLRMTGEDVRTLQTMLNQTGYFVIDNPTNYFGVLTQQMLSNFQRDNRLPINGIADAVTLNKLVQVHTDLANRVDIPPFTKILKSGDSGEDVKTLQLYFRELGYVIPDSSLSIFDQTTQNIVTAFQMHQGLDPMGIADAKTLQRLVDIKNNLPQSFVITGRGWGHSVGMTQWGAKGMAEQNFSHEDILKYYYTNVEIGQRETNNLNIKVLLEPLPNITETFISATNEYSIINSQTNEVMLTIPANFMTELIYSEGQFIIKTSSAAESFEVTEALRTTQPFRVETKEGGLMRYKGIRYKGSFHISLNTSNTIDIVNHVGFEEYVKGVIPNEMSPSWPVEALKAQAVAARGYALTRTRESNRFDVYDSTKSQVYKGVFRVDSVINSVVEETRGKVVTYNGNIIDALYSASAGGHTVDASYMWGFDTPYLKGKPDPYDTSYYSKNYWTINPTAGELSQLFPEVGRIHSIEVTKLLFNRPDELKITGLHGSIVVTGAQFRARFNGAIESRTFEVTPIFDAK